MRKPTSPTRCEGGGGRGVNHRVFTVGIAEEDKGERAGAQTGSDCSTNHEAQRGLALRFVNTLCELSWGEG